MAFETILFERSEDKVATITINRPQAMNSINAKMLEEFDAVWEEVRLDDDIHAVVLRASPGRAFSPGADVREKIDSGVGMGIVAGTNIWALLDPGDRLGPKRKKVWKPMITAVHGICAAGGFYWINESDITICSEDAEFFEPHVTYGLVAALEPIGARFKMPFPEVVRMTLLGNDERICAQTALRLSLVTEVVPLEKLWARAHELAAIIAKKPPAAVQGSIRALWESLDVGRTAALDMALKYCFMGNHIGMAQVNRDEIMRSAKSYSMR